MLNYTKLDTTATPNTPTWAVDVLADIRRDVRGAALTLLAPAEQAGASEVEPEQLVFLGDALLLASEALADVRSSLDAELSSGGEGRESAKEMRGEVGGIAGDLSM